MKYGESKMSIDLGLGKDAQLDQANELKRTRKEVEELTCKVVFAESRLRALHMYHDLPKLTAEYILSVADDLMPTLPPESQ